MTDVFAATCAHWPTQAQEKFSTIRALILLSAQNANAGEIEESLKWGQPAWRPKRARQGSTLRLNWSDKSPQALSLFVDCKSTLSATMQDLYPADFRYEKNRALHMPLGGSIPEQAISHLAHLTFTYHRKP